MKLFQQNYIKQSSRGAQPLAVKDIQFTENRIISFTGKVEPDSAQELISKLLFLDRLSEKPITLMINSGGGDCFSGYAVIDVMNGLRSPVHTVCAGLCASMAAFIFICGKKRSILRHSRIMVHDAALTRMDGRITAAAMSDEIVLLKQMHDENKRLLVECTSLTAKEAERMLAGDTWILADEATAKGLADEILTDAGKLGISPED